MSTYKAYLKSADTPRRMARKAARRVVFVFNKKAAKLRSKVARLERKSRQVEE